MKTLNIRKEVVSILTSGILMFTVEVFVNKCILNTIDWLTVSLIYGTSAIFGRAASLLFSLKTEIKEKYFIPIKLVHAGILTLASTAVMSYVGALKPLYFFPALFIYSLYYIFFNNEKLLLKSDEKRPSF